MNEDSKKTEENSNLAKIPETSNTQEIQPLLDLELSSNIVESQNELSGIKLLGDIFSDKETEEKWKNEWEEIFDFKATPTKSTSGNFGQGVGSENGSNENSNCLPSTLLNQLHSNGQKYNLRK